MFHVESIVLPPPPTARVATTAKRDFVVSIMQYYVLRLALTQSLQIVIAKVQPHYSAQLASHALFLDSSFCCTAFFSSLRTK